MNPQYIQQQQRQFYGGNLPNTPGFGEPNANVQKPPGPPPPTNAPPRPGYYENNGQGPLDVSRQPPPAKQINQNNLVDQMTNISLSSPHRPPSAQQNFAQETTGSTAPPNAGINGIGNQNHYPSTGQESFMQSPGLPFSGSANAPQMSGNQYQGQPQYNSAAHPASPPSGRISGPSTGHPPGPPLGHAAVPPAGGLNISPGGPFPGPPTSHPPASGPPVGPPATSPVGPPSNVNSARQPPVPGQLSPDSNQNLGSPVAANQTRRPMGMPPMPHGQPGIPQPQQNLGRPMMPGQQSMHGPPMPGQHNLSGPPPPGQNTSGPPVSGQNTAPLGNQQNPGYPPMPGQMPPGQQYPQMQRQYMGGPPLPEQNAGVPWQTPGSQPNYQQGYQQNYQDQSGMYGGQYQGGLSGPGYPSSAQPQQVRRLDPDQMPSPIQVIQDDQRTRSGEFITNHKGLVPPLVTTNFIVQDQGNASPRFIRSTMYTVPVNTDIMKQTSIPFGLVLSPMARTIQGEYEPPIVDMGEIGPVRCVRCKAYMNPFMQFINSGRRFQCMFCKATTEVPQEYFQHLDHTGQRLDRFERPELMLGTYEFLATKDYCRNNTIPKPPAIIFVIDVSYNNIKSGLVHMICAQMKNIIRHLPVDAGQSRTNMRVGFITYNNTVHFYNIKSCLAQPQMMVVGDVQDVFMPLLDGFLCDPEESETVIDSLMAQIPSMFGDTRETETILAPAIQAGLEALKASECPGKLLIFHSSLPIAEAPGKLKNRDDRKLLGTDKEKTVLAPQTNVYNNLGQECVGAGCSVDLFIFNNSYIDIATIGQVARLTGGEVFKYTYFQADIDGERLITDIINDISRPIAFDAVMRVRTSTGVRPTDFYGHFFMSNTTDMELASIDCDKAVAIEIKHDDKLAEEEGVYIQAALLYTSCGGIRRLRVINLSLKTSSQMSEVYRTCDLDAIINFFSKQSVFKLVESSPKAIKENLNSRGAIMLAAYRKHCASPSSAAQLILPECMKLLPLYINCLHKCDALNGGGDITIDQKSYVMMAVSTMPIHESVTHFYPRLIALHDVDPHGTDIPPMTRCSIDKFVDDGVFLLENGIHMFMWLGLNLNSQWVQAVFGAASVMQIDTDKTTLPVLDNALNKRITNIIDAIRKQRRVSMRLTIVRQREKVEMVLRQFLVEDRGSDTSPSYVDFLCHMHKQIRGLLS